MIPLLAAVEIDNNTIMVGVVGVLSVLLGLYSKIRSWEKSIRTGDKVELKQPVEINLHDKPMTMADHSNLCGPLHLRVGVLENDVRAIRLKMEADKTEIIHAGEQRAHAIHERINTVLAAVSEVKGEIKHLSR